ncbi:MAG: ABC transporter ATP-binding protein [Planctomycetes bacterium]|nr:ABC transporter ATP-binding protein [Planctomycetota bacterium]
MTDNQPLPNSEEKASDTPPRSGKILIVDKLYKFYTMGGVDYPVLKEIDLEVEAGSFVVIMGPSGSGKSTLLHIVSGLEQPSGGGITLGDQNLIKLNEKARTLLRRDLVGFVFQFYNLIPNLTVEENIKLPLFIAGKEQSSSAETGFDDLIRFFALEGKRKHFPYQLSGGEMQRTSIARALIGRPALIMADEPTGNISSKAGDEVMKLLRRCCDEKGQTILLVTHNARDAGYGDKVYFLKDGEISRSVRLEGKDVNESNIYNCLKKLDI